MIPRPAAVVAALEHFAGSRPPRLDCLEPPVLDSIYLRADVAALTEMAGLEAGAEGSVERAVWTARLVAAVREQNADLIAGLAKPPPKDKWGYIRSLVLVPQSSPQATVRLTEALQAQSLTVELDGHARQLSVQPIPGEMPAGYMRLVITGLPQGYARVGLTERLLQAVGHGSDEVSVVFERAGRVGLPEGTGLAVDALPDLSRVVAVVKAISPGGHRLPKLPRVLRTADWVATISVQTAALSDLTPTLAAHRRQRGGRRPDAPSHPPPPASASPTPPFGNLTGVFASSGITPEVLALGPEPLAPKAVRMARQPGDMRGLGSGALAAGSTHTPFVPAVASPTEHEEEPMPDAPALPLQPPPPELTMQPAPLLEELPSDPGFGVACGWVLDETDLCQEEAQRAVLSASTMQPQAWEAAAGTTRSPDLPVAFRRAIHTQLAATHGAAVASALEVTLPQGLTAGAEMLGEDEGAADGLAAAAATDGRGRSYAAAARAATRLSPSPRRSSRTHEPPREWWAPPPPPPPPLSPASPHCRATHERGGGPQ